MKSLLLLIILISLAITGFGAVVTSTNVDGIVLRLELAATRVVAGERLNASMVVSNASQAIPRLKWQRQQGYRDTGIGDFVVTDDIGHALPKTVPFYEMEFIGSSGGDFPPGKSETFAGDLVYSYSLTNPGTYQVKSIAMVPQPRDATFDAMVIETPSLSITVEPRPEQSPPPPPLYHPIPAGMSPGIIAAVTAEKRRAIEPLRVTHPKLEMPQVPRVAPREAHSPLPQGKQGSGNGPTTGASGASAKKEPPVLPSRGVLFALVAVLLSGGVVLCLVWSRRKHGHL
jgi:hypothetical protein